MDSREFDKVTRPLLRWNKKADRDVLKKQIKQCEDCDKTVENRSVVCVAYRIGTPLAHFKHQCTVCKKFLFDGMPRAEARTKKRKYNNNSGENYK
jgi:hypothetical protein